jgi:predicted SAM-dependent methyltransferase
MYKLNIAAGKKRYEGWTNVDAVAGDGIDIVANMSSVPLPDSCADEIMVIHGIEHIYAWEVPGALSEFFRLLARGGSLQLEMPDIVKSCRNVADGYYGGKHIDQMGLWGIFGDPRLKEPAMCHRYGWTFASLRPLVEAAGFGNVEESQTKFHRCGRDMRDFRLEARKP